MIHVDRSAVEEPASLADRTRDALADSHTFHSSREARLEAAARERSERRQAAVP